MKLISIQYFFFSIVSFDYLIGAPALHFSFFFFFFLGGGGYQDVYIVGILTMY